MQGIASRVARSVTLLCGALVAVMVLIIIADVASRNLLSISVTSSAEIAILLQIYITFLAAAVGVQRGLHFVIFSETGSLSGTSLTITSPKPPLASMSTMEYDNPGLPPMWYAVNTK
jgi:hypothetical protein